MDKALKQRLTGAIILIALAIIFLPMLLNGDRQQQQKARIELPQQPVVNFPTRRLPIGQHSLSPQTSVARPVDELVLTGVELMPEAPVEAEKEGGIVIVPLQSASRQQTTRTETEVTVSEAHETAPALPPTGGQWKVQVASFAAQANAEKLMTRLRRTGYQANIDRLIRDKTTLYRVLVPGYPDRKSASLAAQSISKQIEGVNPTVMPPESKIDDPIVDATIVSSGTRWVVQVGSFGQSENAQKLVQQLQKQGYAAYWQQNDNIYKVLVGPMISRDKALSKRDALFKKNKLKGLVKEN